MQTDGDNSYTTGTDTIRRPGVAGYFYPYDPGELRQMLETLLQNTATRAPPPKALIAPHAGYVYSGPVAATAYATLLPVRQQIKKVVLLGPAHRVHLRGMALSTATRFATPLGMIAVDTELKTRLSALRQISMVDAAFDQEHSLEVHLPFLQTVLEDFSVLPLVVGDTTTTEVAEVLESVWGGEETLIVISSDLSHYHDYRTAGSLDRQTGELIRTFSQDKLGPHQACGYRPISGLLQIAAQRAMELAVLDIRNSGDTAGSRDRVVGYGAFSLHAPQQLSPSDRQQLLDLAFASIDHGLTENKALVPDINRYSHPLTAYRAEFVTLMLDGELRGCIGTTEANLPLVNAIADSAFNAAFSDPRFRKLTRSEYERLHVDISVLSPLRALDFESEQTLMDQLRPRKDGLVISGGGKRSTFLPSVWKQLPGPEKFLARLKAKAGISADEMPDSAWIYQAESFGRPE